MTDDPTTLPDVETQRQQLRQAVIEAPRKLRVVYIGNFLEGPTGIVSCLARALEGLGHTVFRLDVRNHPGIRDNPERAQGGMGPIWLKVNRISTILDTFKPEVLVACAGGMVLAPEDQEELKRRGILSVGITLSDPDVMPTVIDHVGGWDVHTTNARLSHSEYLKRGLTNTTLMPFGIDRSFAERSVAARPEFEADAICIGHGTGRTERWEIMGELAHHVNVRVYGRGWQNFPEAGPVAGDDLLAAAASGTFHVNFPLTRAGYQNVKCGVFETIGAGAVLCSERFDELGDLFDYDEEIIGYSDGEDLGKQLRALLDEPGRVEQVRRRSFHRLINHHLYEHRWLDLFAGVEERIRTDEALAHASESFLAADRQRPRNVLISGYFGHGNRGDELLLESLATSLESAAPDTLVSVVSANAPRAETRTGRPGVMSTDPYDCERASTLASAVILGPGGLWHDYSIADAGGMAGAVSGATKSPAHLLQLPLIATSYGAQFHVVGMGVGPLQAPAARAAVNATGRLASTIALRDEESLEWLGDMPQAWGATVSVQPDLVYGINLDGVTAPDKKPYIAVNLRTWQENEYHDHVRTIVLETAAQRGLDVVAVPMMAPDENLLAQWADNSQGVNVEVIPVTASDADLMGALAGAQALVSMRLHANLLAHRLGRPCVGLAYDPKVTHHFNSVGRAEYAITLDQIPGQLAELLAQALNTPQLDKDVMGRIRGLESRVADYLQGLGDVVGALDPVIPGEGNMISKPVLRNKQDPAWSLTGWAKDTVVNLASLQTSSYRVGDPTAEVGKDVGVGPRGDLRVQLESRAPRKGDCVQVAFPADNYMLVPRAKQEKSGAAQAPEPYSPPGRKVEIVMSVPYPDKPDMTGRLALEVLHQGKVLMRQPVAGWQDYQHVWVNLPLGKRVSDLAVRIRAMRDCEDWGWGPAGAVTIRGIRVRPSGIRAMRVGASSPTAILFTERAPREGSHSNSLVSRSKRKLRRVVRKTLGR